MSPGLPTRDGFVGVHWRAEDGSVSHIRVDVLLFWEASSSGRIEGGISGWANLTTEGNETSVPDVAWLQCGPGQPVAIRVKTFDGVDRLDETHLVSVCSTNVAVRVGANGDIDLRRL